MLEDKLLLWKFKRGSSEALERIYEKYETYLFTIATTLLNDTHAAEDVVHDFIISFVKSVENVKSNGSLKAYLATCVANLSRDKLRRRQREPKSLDGNATNESTPATPDGLVMQTEEALILHRAMAQLPYEQREVIVLHLQGNLKFTQIAKTRNTSVNTIRSQYRYGLDKLRSLLNREVIQ